MSDTKSTPDALRVMLEQMQGLIERWRSSRAHTYASENADLYRGFDNGCQRCADDLAALLSALSRTPELYDGPIEVGMHFIWEPSKPHAWARITVEEIMEPEGRERAIRAAGVWNEEGRFREACVPCDANGKITPVLSSPSAAPQEPQLRAFADRLWHRWQAEKLRTGSDHKAYQQAVDNELRDMQPLKSAAPSGEAHKAIASGADACFSMAGDCERAARNTSDERMLKSAENWREHARILKRLAASQGVSAPAVAEIEQEMRNSAGSDPSWETNRKLKTDWASRLAALRGEQK